MYRKFFVLIAVSLLSVIRTGAQDASVNVSGVTCEITFYSPSTVRVVKTPPSAVQKYDNDWVVTASPKDIIIGRKENSKSVTLRTRELTVIVDKATGAVRFLHSGKVLLTESRFTYTRITEGPDEGSFSMDQTFTLDADEAIYGLGTVQDGRLNRRGTHTRIEQTNLEDFQNIIQSVKGWGLFFDNYSVSGFNDSEAGMKFSFSTADRLDYYFMYGGSLDGTVGLIRDLTGSVPMFPLWTYGFWQCRERYRSSAELLEVVDRHRASGVPLDGIIQDWQYWGSNYLWNAMEFLNDEFSDARRMIDRVHGQNAHIMISIWASFGPMTKPYRELSEKGLLHNFITWPQSGSSIWPPRTDYPSGVRCYMPYDPEARSIYWKYLKHLFDMGIDAWWMDSTDPDFINPVEENYRQMTPQGSFRRVRNAFPLQSVKGVYENQRSVTSDRRVFIMTRSAFAGQQRYGCNMWSGDVNSTWEVLRTQVPVGLNFSVTGNPNFNTDIGGFFLPDTYFRTPFGSPTRNPQFQELYVRWMQYALFCPVFRSHGSAIRREIYEFGQEGEPVYDAILSTIRFRYRMLPYLYSIAREATAGNASYMMPLASQFPSDRRVWDITDEFIFGRSILATPVLEAQYTDETPSLSPSVPDFTGTGEVTKYLPAGADWYWFWNEELYHGGSEVTVSTSLDRTPFFVKAGSILPFGPEVQYASEKKWDLLDIVVYPGADATFTLYEDEGDGYAYENGVFSEITFVWKQNSGTLEISPVKGTFPGMPESRTFNIRKAGSEETVSVVYDGSAVSLKL